MTGLHKKQRCPKCKMLYWQKHKCGRKDKPVKQQVMEIVRSNKAQLKRLLIISIIIFLFILLLWYLTNYTFYDELSPYRYI